MVQLPISSYALAVLLCAPAPTASSAVPQGAGNAPTQSAPPPVQAAKPQQPSNAPAPTAAPADRSAQTPTTEPTPSAPASPTSPVAPAAGAQPVGPPVGATPGISTAPTAPLQAQPGAPGTGGSVLTLDRARALATGQPATDVLQAEQDARLAEEDVKQARAAFFPVVSAPLSYIYSSPSRRPEDRLLPLRERPPAFIANNAINEFVLLTNAEGTIDINGRLRAALDKSRADFARARAAALVARRGIYAATADAYYGLALARAKRDVAEQSLQSARDFLHTAQLLFEGGEVAELDTLKAQIEVTSRTDELLQARAAEAEAADTLNALAGIEFGTATAVQDLALALPDPSDMAGLTVDRIANRPEFALYAAEEQSADAEARVARAERRPSLTYSVSAGIDDSAIEPQRDLGASASVTLTIPIFDAGASRSRERQALVKRETAGKNRAIAERSLRQQFSIARTQAELAAERVRLVGAGVADAVRALDVSVLRYQGGEAPVTEVLDARTTLAAQRNAFYQAIYDYRIAVDRLRLAVGQ